MKIRIKIQNKNKQNLGKWITLPTSNAVIDEVIEKVCVANKDKCIVTNFVTILYSKCLDLRKLRLNDLDIVGFEDIYYLNEIIYKLNQNATDEEIVALTEVYSDSLEGILNKVQSGTYKFYFNRFLGDIAEKFSHRPEYKYYSDVQIVDELCKLGYRETTTGVIIG